MVKDQPAFFKIQGMDCAEEVAVLKREVGPLVGGEDRLGFDILNGRMTVTPASTNVTLDSICQAVARTGMKAEAWRDEPTGPKVERFWSRRGRTVLTLASSFFTALGFLVHAWMAGGFRAALGAGGTDAAHDMPLALRPGRSGWGMVCLAQGVVCGPKAAPRYEPAHDGGSVVRGSHW